MMIPDCQRRLDEGAEKLLKLVTDAEDDVKETEIFAAALESLEAAKAASV